jgi:putative restriction endonuclease
MTMPSANTQNIAAELESRLRLWSELKLVPTFPRVPGNLLRSRNIHRGQHGIFRDLGRTRALTDDGCGVAVGLRSSGGTYPDEHDTEGITYAFPATRRGRRDLAEIASLEACLAMNLPVFVVLNSKDSRDPVVRLGWFEGIDSKCSWALIAFADAQERKTLGTGDEIEFTLQGAGSRALTTANRKHRHWRFKFDVFRRYGPQCAVCEVKVPELLDAAHLCPVADDGADDPRNGLVLCTSHHRAFDLCLIAVDPTTLIITSTGVYSLSELGVTRSRLEADRPAPHETALSWAWARIKNQRQRQRGA